MGEKRKPVVSIIIPVFNRKEVIIETIESVLSQSYEYWEAVFIDDHSTDGTLEVIEKYKLKDSRIKLSRRSRLPKGASACRNLGLEESIGEYVVFLDSDDVLTTDCLKSRVSIFDKHPTCDFLVFPMGHFHKYPGESMKTWSIAEDDDRNKDLDRFLRKDWHLMIGWLTTSPIWKRQTLIELGGFDESLPDHQDFDLHVRALIEGFSYKKINTTPDWFYRMNNSGKISKGKISIEVLKRRKELFLKLFCLLKEKSILTSVRIKFLHVQLENTLREMVKNNYGREKLLFWKDVFGVYRTVPQAWLLLMQLPIKIIGWSIYRKTE